MFDGNGNWTSDFSAQADRDNGIKILASRFDDIFIADIKESFENCLTKDGQIAPIGNFNMGGQKITNVGTGTNDADAVNKAQMDNASTSLQTQIDTKANTSDVVNLTGTQTISGQKTFSTVAYGTASDASNSILTTIAKTKAAKGGFKLGNGMIVNWGTISDSGGTVTYSIPFSGTNYGISMTRISANGTNDNDAITAVTSTNFSATIYQGGGAHWVAIGY